MPSQERQIRETERMRVGGIHALGERYKDKFGDRSIQLAETLIEEGIPIEGARSQFLDLISEPQQPIGAPWQSDGNPSGQRTLGLSGKEQRDYSFAKAILFNSGLISEREAGLEVECHKELARGLNRQPKGFLIPIGETGQRNYLTNTPSLGGNLVATDLAASSFIDLLRNKALCLQMGVTQLNGLVGNTAIPRRTQSATAYWVPEDGDIPESTGAFDQVMVTPKQLGALSRFSRLMCQQSTPSIEQLIRADFAQVLALALDAAIIAGAGTGGAPRGILQTSGIGTVSLGTNGGAPTFVALTEMLRILRAANADTGSLGWMISPNVAKKFQSTLRNPSGTDSGFILGDPEAGSEDSIVGIKVGTTNQIPSNLTKGTGTGLSGIILANWADVILAEWGMLEIQSNPYGDSDFSKGRIAVRAFMSCDIAVRHPQSFVACTDVLTI